MDTLSWILRAGGFTTTGLATILSLIGAGILAGVVRWHWRLAAVLRRPRAQRIPLEHYPSISVIRPVRGADVGAEENFTAALATGYPGEVETLFIFDSSTDPGLPIAERVVRRHRAAGRPGSARVLVAGAPPAGWTGKLNAMRHGVEVAHGELIAFGDSDTRPSPVVLTALVEALLGTPDAGSAFAPVLVHEPARGAGDALYALMQNALYSPLAAARAGTLRELPFIMGQLMVFHRKALGAIGGVGAARGQLVDDMYLGKCLSEAGYKNVMVHEPLHIATGGMSLREFLPVYRRWMMFSRNGLPLSFTWPQWLVGIAYFVGLAAFIVAMATGHFGAAVLSGLAVVAQGVSLLVLQRRYGGAAMPLRFAWTPFAFFLLAPVVLASNLLRRQVNWRGRVYSLNGQAALARPVLATPAAKLAPESRFDAQHSLAA